MKSLINATNLSIDSLILDIFIILGIVVAGALLVYFLWELISYLFKNKASSSKKETKAETKQQDLLFVDYNPDAEKEETKVEEEKVEDEVKEENEEKEEVLLDEVKLEEVDEKKAEAEKAEVEDEISKQERANQERRAYLEARRQELIRRMQEEMENDSKEEAEEETEVVAEADAAEEEPEEIKTEEVVETEAVDHLAEEKEALEREKEKYAVMVKELEEAKKALAVEKAAAAPVVETTIVRKGALTLDELKAKLEQAEEQFKITDKEFKQCKKEYNPLRRVWTTHEKDEKKLRRKEALVAKQKVILYGVNNYADIDEEKAKKLAEDLDLLDGLKLSVQHCEEVMAKNAERYPLLEKMYKVLETRNEELKKDIEYYRSEIARLEAEEE